MVKTIALLTDFGTTDTYVGVMKGVIAGIAPDARVIDITHAIPPQDVRAGALALMTSFRYFPPETVFVVIVDPGVGSTRHPIAVQSGGYTFIAPDNGVLSYMLAENPTEDAPIKLDNAAYHLPEISQTFHGRDIFAPTAAHLAADVGFAEIGTPVGSWKGLEMPTLTEDGDRIHGEIIQIDHFGNVMTSIGRFRWLEDDHLRFTPAFGAAIQPRVSLATRCDIQIGDTRIEGISHNYSEAYPGAVLALVGSSGFLELSINLGSFADLYNVHVGYPLTLEAG